MRKSAHKKLTLNKEALRRLDVNKLVSVGGGLTPLTTVTVVIATTVSLNACGSRNGCTTLSGDGCNSDCQSA